MRSFERLRPRLCALALGASIASGAAAARADQPALGFALNRYYEAPAGSRWLVMNDLASEGSLGGAIAVTAGYAHNPLTVTDGARSIDVVTDHTALAIGLALTWERVRLSTTFTSPLGVRGQSGSLGGYDYTGPSLDFGHDPDSLSDVRAGFDVRLYGAPDGPLRLGASADLWIPSGDRHDYGTDSTYRGMWRLLLAGDAGRWSYAAHAGVHFRLLDEKDEPGSPRGQELLFGVAAAQRLPFATHWMVGLGPEIVGQTAFRAFFGDLTTGVEALLGARLEERSNDAPRLGFKAAAGVGIHSQFGTPDWRLVLSIDVADRLRRIAPSTPPAAAASGHGPQRPF